MRGFFPSPKEIDEEKISVFQYVAGEEASVNLTQSGFAATLATASATCLDKGRWWVNRVKVQNTLQGLGFGSEVLIRLQKLIQAADPGANVIVCPGGYDNNEERQRRFYERHGFAHVKGTRDRDEWWEWKADDQRCEIPHGRTKFKRLHVKRSANKD